MFYILPRLVLWDLIKITIMAWAGISALLMAGGGMVEAGKQGLDPLKVLVLMPYLIPQTLPFTIPTCLLFACTVVYGRMAANIEITALKAGGISAMVVIRPAIVLGLMVAGGGVFMANHFIPACNAKITQFVLADIEANILTYLRMYGSIVEPDSPYEVYVKGIRGDRLIQPIFKHRGKDGTYDVVAQAAEATLHVWCNPDTEEMEVTLRLIDGVLTNKKGENVHFRDESQRMPLPGSAGRRDVKIDTLDFEGCLAHAQLRSQQYQTLDFELASVATDGVLMGDPASMLIDMEINRTTAERHRRKAREASAEIHMRITQWLVAVPFILLGCPIGILFQRRDFLQSFFVCFLPIVTIYYPVMILAYNVVKEGVGNPLLAIWSPPVIMALCAIPFIRRVVRF